MKKIATYIIDSFFGKNPKTRFKRLIILLIVILVSIMMFFNLNVEVKKGNVGCSWKSEDLPRGDK